MPDRDSLPSATDSRPSVEESLIFRAAGFYASLIRLAEPCSTQDSSANEEPGLGGKLVYAADLDDEGRALVVAGNIAGAASLATTADTALQKQAIRDGVIDFLVTNLDEALRILKNEIRKRQSVSVCVATDPAALEGEMLERGVLPDLLAPAAASAPASASFLAQGSRLIGHSHLDQTESVVTWSVSAAPAQWLPKLDAIALDCLGPSNAAARRWLRLSPRYLGRLANGVRLLACDRNLAMRFIDQVRGQVARGEIGVDVRIQLLGKGVSEEYKFSNGGS